MSTPFRLWFDRGVNLAMLWTGSALAGSGLVMEFRFEPGPGRPLTVWGLDWNAWATLHYTLGLIMLGLITIHVWRHRTWWKNVLCRQRSIALILVFIVALCLLLVPMFGP